MHRVGGKLGRCWDSLRCKILSCCVDRRKTREDCVSWLPGSKFSPDSLTHKFGEQYYLSRQRYGILGRRVCFGMGHGVCSCVYLPVVKTDHLRCKEHHLHPHYSPLRFTLPSVLHPVVAVSHLNGSLSQSVDDHRNIQ